MNHQNILNEEFEKISEKVLANMLYLSKKHRDSGKDILKSTNNYTRLMNYYPLDKTKFFKFNNREMALEDAAKKIILENDKDFIVQKSQLFPIVILADLENKDIMIKDCNKKFQLPKILSENHKNLKTLYQGSTLYNNQCHRLDDVFEENDRVVLITSETSYFDFCASNRMIDYETDEQYSIRQYFANGPKFPSLKESKLANLLGFNMSIITADNKVIYVKRFKNLSVEKGMYGNGVQASLKYAYTHEHYEHLTVEGLWYAVKREIMDELRMKDELKITNTEIQKSLRTIYYDYVEAKPQLYFELKLPFPWTFEQIRKNANQQNIENSIKEDGSEFIGIDIERLEEIFVTPYGFSFDCKFYPMVPSASYCVAQLIENHRKIL